MDKKILAVVVPTMRHRSGIDDKSVPEYIIAVAPTEDLLETFLLTPRFAGYEVVQMSLEDAKSLTGYQFDGWN